MTNQRSIALFESFSQQSHFTRRQGSQPYQSYQVQWPASANDQTLASSYPSWSSLQLDPTQRFDRQQDNRLGMAPQPSFAPHMNRKDEAVAPADGRSDPKDPFRRKIPKSGQIQAPLTSGDMRKQPAESRDPSKGGRASAIQSRPQETRQHDSQKQQHEPQLPRDQTSIKAGKKLGNTVPIDDRVETSEQKSKSSSTANTASEQTKLQGKQSRDIQPKQQQPEIVFPSFSLSCLILGSCLFVKKLRRRMVSCRRSGDSLFHLNRLRSCSSKLNINLSRIASCL
jgi:hypothetical protein